MDSNGLFRDETLKNSARGIGYSIIDLPSAPAPARSRSEAGEDDEGRSVRRAPVSLRRYAEPLANERLGSPNGEVQHLLTLLDQVREGTMASGKKMFPWSREQIETLWDNLIRGWSIGMLIALDLTGHPELSWPERFGPYPTKIEPGKRTSLLFGAEKMAALAWSLADPPTAFEERLAPDESAIWARDTLVVDVNFRRVQFVRDVWDARRQLPVRLLPRASACVNAMNRMEITPVEREWLNRTARRLMEARISVYLLPAEEAEDAARMIDNFRQIGVLP
ncbi:MAG: hypothetical protein WCF85_08535 [Rhodospirillaceae bacterium]